MKNLTKPEREKLWDAGLSALELKAKQDVQKGGPCPSFTSEQIAQSVGASRQAVDRVVQTALAKLRPRLAHLKAEQAA
jgi:hypothetical protein